MARLALILLLSCRQSEQAPSPPQHQPEVAVKESLVPLGDCALAVEAASGQFLYPAELGQFVNSRCASVSAELGIPATSTRNALAVYLLDKELVERCGPMGESTCVLEYSGSWAFDNRKGLYAAAECWRFRCELPEFDQIESLGFADAEACREAEIHCFPKRTEFESNGVGELLIGTGGGLTPYGHTPWGDRNLFLE